MFSFNFLDEQKVQVMIINNFAFLKNIKISYEEKNKLFDLSEEDINFLETFNNYLKSETINSIGIYSADKNKLLKIQQTLISIITLSSISNQFLINKKNTLYDYKGSIGKNFLIGNQQCKLIKIFDINDVTIVEYEILNIKTKRKTKKNLNKANVQIPLTKFRSENPEFLKDDKGFQNIKENVTITDVNESEKFENDWINLLLDPEDAYPDTNINLKKNSFSVSYLTTAQHLRKLKNIIIGTKKKDESKPLSELFLFDDCNSKNSLYSHVVHSSNLEKLQDYISSEDLDPSILFIQSSKMLMDFLNDGFYNKYKKRVVFLEPNDLAPKNDQTKPNIEILKNYGFKFIDIGKFDENSMRLIGKVNPITNIHIHKFTESLIPRIYTLIRKIKQDERFSYYTKSFFRLSYRTLSSFFKSHEFIRIKSEDFQREIDRILSYGHLEEAKLLKAMKDVLIPYMELMRISKDTPGIRLRVFIDSIAKILENIKFNSNPDLASESEFLIAIIYDKKESSYTSIEMKAFASIFEEGNIKISFHDINEEFDNEFSPYILVFPNLLKNDISTMINIPAKNKFLILDQYEFRKFDKIRTEFIDTKAILKTHEFSVSNIKDTNIFDHFKITSRDDISKLFKTELIQKNILDTYSIISQEENITDYDEKWDYEEFSDKQDVTIRSSSDNTTYTKEAYAFNFRLEKNYYELICEKGHKVLIYDLDNENFDTKRVEKIPEILGNFKVLLPINWNKELRFKISDEILKKGGVDLVKIKDDISLWKSTFKSLVTSTSDIQINAKVIIPNIHPNTVRGYLYDNELIGPGKRNQTYDYLTRIFSASTSYGAEVNKELIDSIEKSIKLSRNARQKVQTFINERVVNNFDINNSIYNDELIGEIGSFDFINCNLDVKIDATQDMINKLSKESF